MTQRRSKLWRIFSKGIIKENPVLRLMLGCCSALAVTTSASNSVGMGIATAFVLICSNAVISLLRNIIPGKVRIPAYITIVASFVTVAQFLVQAYTPELDKALGVYLPLIAVNCIILGRAEMFARKNGVLLSVLDGAGMGIGYTLALLIIGIVREILGAGSIFGISVMPEPIVIFLLPPGGFFVFAMLIAFVGWFTRNKKTPLQTGCLSCPMAASCHRPEKNEIAGTQEEGGTANGCTGD